MPTNLDEISDIHERALRAVSNDYSYNFEELLIKDKSVTKHDRNVQQLAIKILIKHCNLQLIMPSVFNFTENSNYNLSTGINLNRSLLQISQYGRNFNFNLIDFWSILYKRKLS